jgi:hypothetical protein
MMAVYLGNPLVLIAVFILPFVLAGASCLRWGPNRGMFYAMIPLFVGIFVLFYFQVSPGIRPDGSGRVASAWGYMRSETIMWSASFLVGAAVGSGVWKLRRTAGGKG